MNVEEARHHLNRLRKRYLLLKASEIFVWAIAAGSFIFGVLTLITSSPYVYGISGITAIGIFILTFLNVKLHSFNERRLISFIDQQYKNLESSTDLLVKDSRTLTSLEQLQQQKALTEFMLIHSTIKLPHRLGTSILLFCLALSTSFFLSKLKWSNAKHSIANTNPDIRPVREVKLPVAVKTIKVKITPPAYTRINASTTTNPQINIPEGSLVNWTIAFTDSVTDASLIFGAKETVTLSNTKYFFTTTQKFISSTFYQIQWKNSEGEIKRSDYYKIDVMADHSPEVTITNLEQSFELGLKDNLVINIRSTINDDYRINDGYIIATVSKGSGESVKFREEKLPFTTPSKISGKKLNASRTIDLLKLGLEPGDELYFYAEAIDNKQPVANRSRTETYFITLRDTTSQQLSIDGGLGVDLMPQYFRSQRQIIIDTEKLLKEKKQMRKKAFISKSNELGYDQKVLRLRYGVFLGEEFETQIGEADIREEETHEEEEEEEDEDKDLTKKYSHIHDTNNEHNLVEEKKRPAGHDHGTEEDPEKEKNPIDAYKHQHDNVEEATFFSQSIRAKMKAALTEMWNAELYLRLSEPQRSLPYQYKALKLLKEISNDSRIYVHKTGFDPPPLKEENRLSGDLSEIRSTRYQTSHGEPEIYPAIRTGLKLLEKKLHQPSPEFSAGDKKILHDAGNELSERALERPGKFLEALSTIRAINEEEIRDDDLRKALPQLQKAFWDALPNEAITPGRNEQATHTLDRVFIKTLDDLKNE